MTQLILPTNVFAKKIETRSMPSLLEQRNNLLTQMDNLVKKAKEETRSLSEEENTEFEKAKTEVEQIDKTLQAEQTAKDMNQQKMQQSKTPEAEEKRSLEEEKFLKFIKGEERALDVSGNGGIIPETIADRIIMRVKELSPIYALSTVFNVGGNLIFPKFDPNTIQTAYVADMTQLTATNGNFTTVKLQNFIAGSLVQLSRSLINRTDFDLTSFIVNRMSESIADFLERELLVGVGGTDAATGIFVDADITPVTAESATAITLDDLINTQMAVPEQFQGNAGWIMNKQIFKGIRQLKDADGYPLLNNNITEGFGYTLLGRPVYVSESAPSTIEANANVLSFGDYSGLYVKLAQNVEIQVLQELYATQHALGICGYIEFDAKVVEPQRITRLKMAAV
jgi:HK97 family phage major capsid protein